MQICKEAFSADLFCEILPLAQKCWEENTKIKAESCAFYGERDFSVEPDIEAYQRQAASLVIITLRDSTRLVGYIVGLLYRSPHHKRILCGNVDSIYVEPDCRSYTVVMMERFEKEMCAMGAQIIGWPTSLKSPIYGLLKARGYAGDDTIMEKRLCVSL